MKHKIDPTNDCVFKALLGSEKKKSVDSFLKRHEYFNNLLGKKRNYDIYQRRIDHLTQQRTIECELDTLKREKQKAEQEKQEALDREVKYLKALKKAGIDPKSLT